MASGRIQEIVLIGAGNVASNLGYALSGLGYRVVQVYNRSEGAGNNLAAGLGAEYVPALSGLTGTADLYIVAVSDSAISEVCQGLHLGSRLIVHTSGSVGMDVLNSVSVNSGVFYPLQTFSPGRRISFREIPVCLEASTQEAGKMLEELAHRLSETVRFIDSRQRRLLHLAAVFSCNFPNLLWSVAEELTGGETVAFDLLKPLILQTAANATLGNVLARQTGPAMREDYAVMEEHKALLADHPDFLELYDLLSRTIIEFKKSHEKL